MSLTGLLFLSMLPKNGEFLVSWSTTKDSRGVDVRVVNVIDPTSGEVLFVANVIGQVPR